MSGWLDPEFQRHLQEEANGADRWTDQGVTAFLIVRLLGLVRKGWRQLRRKSLS